MNKIPASKVSASSSVRSSAPASVSCDDQYECPDEYTCCHMLDGGWGCCPYMQAVCCETECTAVQMDTLVIQLETAA
ncbi:hypothetical protein EB796_002273 [Bugula neritina]|uniref:Granulins domain-containing protein n=1 Tax=Bugula neritina TaxID=10212 RepID=A0A7J7KMM2_BUGNE|nr:hypothetical protein EB796_002273 [Bugula neritina]